MVKFRELAPEYWAGGTLDGTSLGTLSLHSIADGLPETLKPDVAIIAAAHRGRLIGCRVIRLRGPLTVCETLLPCNPAEHESWR
jgi:hypothetical protein